MWRKIVSLWRVTAVRLSLIYILIFGVAAVGIIAYMTGGTVNLVRQQYQKSIDEEVEELARVFQRGGLPLMFRVLERRANAPGANLYAVSNPQGEIIAGNVPGIERRIMRRTGWTRRPFAYERFDQRENGSHDDDDDDHGTSRAIARVLEVPNGMRVLVGRDVREYEVIGNVVADAFKIAIGIMAGFGLLTWYFVGRRALIRIDRVTQSSERILSGDRSERLPVTGSNDEFDRLSENLNRMLDRINALDVGVKQISDNIAHDLKTPITRLRNKAYEALHDRSGEESRRVTLEELITDCDQIVKTFDALMMISRVGSGARIGKLYPVDLNEIVADVHELYDAVAEEEGAALSLKLADAKKIYVQGNRELLSQAVSNLLDNALKYGKQSEEQPQIGLSIRQTDGQAEIVVTDNGPGISQEDRTNVTERFVRLDKSRNLPGNGLGLSLVDAIVKFHSGELILEDNHPGLSVSLRFPVSGVEEL